MIITQAVTVVADVTKMTAVVAMAIKVTKIAVVEAVLVLL